MSANPITVGLPSGSLCTFIGRDAWALRQLMAAGKSGVTPIDNPAPRWSHYIYKLRQAGIIISTEHEPHAGPFPGTHGRYRLETKLQLIKEEGVL